jgi:two-component system, sensor histidine kinase and response regulator
MLLQNKFYDKEKRMVTTFQIEGIDIKSALGRVAGNEKLLRKLLGRFVETQSDVAKRIKTAIKSNDIEIASREAHTIKGLAGSIGATTLFYNAEILENLLKKPDKNHLDEALIKFETELNQILQRITASVEISEESSLL